VFVVVGYPQGGSVFGNLLVFIFYMYIGNLVNLSSGAMSVRIKYPLFIYLACSVKKAGYSGQVLFCVFMDREEVEIKRNAKRDEANIRQQERMAKKQKKRSCLCGTNAGNPEQARWVHLSRFGSQSENRIRFFLPSRGFSHLSHSINRRVLF